MVLAVEFAVREIHVGVPVEDLVVVFARADVVSHAVADERLVQRRHDVGRKSFASKEFPDWFGFMDREPFAALVRPEVFVRAGDVDGPRRDERDEFMLVERQLVFAIDVFSVIAAEPMLEGVLDDLQRLAEAASGDGGS